MSIGNVVKRASVLGAMVLACGVATRGPGGDSTVSSGRVQQFKAVHYLYTSVETRMAGGQIAKDAHELAHGFNEALRSGKLHTLGPAIFTFVGNTGEMNKPFTMTYGIPVDADVKEMEGYKVMDLPEMKAFTVLYSGKSAGVSDAYVAAYSELGQQGLVPDGTSRQMLLYWESEESSNNVFQVQIGVK